MRSTATLAVALVLLAGCGAQPEPRSTPNVVLVVIDTLRADHLGTYGYDQDTSPFLTQLANRGVVFEDVTSPASQTVPSVLSMFTGVYPSRHGNQYFGSTDSFRVPKRRSPPSVPEELPLMAERFQALGRRTAAVVTNPWLQEKWGFARGFDRYENLGHGGRGGDVNAAAAAILDEIQARPFFLYLHYMDVHAPYLPSMEHYEALGDLEGRPVHWNGTRPTPVASEDIASARALYDACIRTMDDWLRALAADLDTRELLDTTLVVVTSDHGEEFYEHRGLGHGHSLYGEVVGVPLLIVHPSLPARRISTPVGLIDLLPTMLDLLGHPVPDDLGGTSLAPLMRDPDTAVAAERPLFSEIGLARAIRRGDRKLIRHLEGGTEELFDLAADPREGSALRAAPWAEALRKELTGFLVQTKPVGDPDGDEPGVEPGSELERRLKTLGYLDD